MKLPLTGFMELHPDQLRHHHEISPRGMENEAPPRNYRGITP